MKNVRIESKGFIHNTVVKTQDGALIPVNSIKWELNDSKNNNFSQVTIGIDIVPLDCDVPIEHLELVANQANMGAKEYLKTLLSLLPVDDIKSICRSFYVEASDEQ